MGRTFSHTPDSRALEARRRARSLETLAPSSRASAKIFALMVSHTFCWHRGGETLSPIDHCLSASSTNGMGELRRVGGTMWRTRSEKAAADAKKAEGASCTTLRTPSPPNFTGKVACSQAGSDSSKWMLVIPLTIDRNVLSYTSKAGERKHGDVLRLYNSFGMAKECFRRRMASWEERCTSLSPIFFSKAVFSSRMLLMEEYYQPKTPAKMHHLDSHALHSEVNLQKEL